MHMALQTTKEELIVRNVHISTHWKEERKEQNASKRVWSIDIPPTIKCLGKEDLRERELKHTLKSIYPAVEKKTRR